MAERTGKRSETLMSRDVTKERRQNVKGEKKRKEVKEIERGE